MRLTRSLENVYCQRKYDKMGNFESQEKSGKAANYIEVKASSEQIIFSHPEAPNSFRSIETFLRLQLHGAIYRPDSFVLVLCYCANLKAIRYESTSLNRIVADKSHRVIVA